MFKIEKGKLTAMRDDQGNWHGTPAMIRAAKLVEVAGISPSNPWPEKTIAEAIATELGATVVEVSPPNNVPGMVY